MFNQDDPREKKQKMPERESAQGVQIMDENTKFDWYFRESSCVRARYGIGKFENKFFIADKKKIDLLDEIDKAKLRDWVKVQIANGRWFNDKKD